MLIFKLQTWCKTNIFATLFSSFLQILEPFPAIRSHITCHKPLIDVTTQCHVFRCCVTMTWPKTITVTAECKHRRPTSVCRGRTPGHDLLPRDGPGEPAAGAGDQLEQLDQLELEREPAGCGGVVTTQGPALLATAAAAQGWSSLAPCCRDVTRYLHTIDICRYL